MSDETQVAECSRTFLALALKIGNKRGGGDRSTSVMVEVVHTCH